MLSAWAAAQRRQSSEQHLYCVRIVCWGLCVCVCVCVRTASKDVFTNLLLLQRAVSELDDTERHKLKKKAIKVSKFDADKRDLLQVSYTSFVATLSDKQVMESTEKREARTRPPSRGMQACASLT